MSALHRSKKYRYSITSSAATSNLPRMLRPSALTLLRLITRSNLVERCTPNEAATRLLCRLDRRLKYARQRQAEGWLHRRQQLAVAHMSGGLSHRRPKTIVDQVPPESIRAAARDIACCAFDVHVLAVGTCAIS